MDKKISNDDSFVDVCSMIFEQVEKPKNLEICKAINVYDNRYRVNIYTRTYDPLHGVDKIRITQSYFCSVKNNELNILF